MRRVLVSLVVAWVFLGSSVSAARHALTINATGLLVGEVDLNSEISFGTFSLSGDLSFGSAVISGISARGSGAALGLRSYVEGTPLEGLWVGGKIQTLRGTASGSGLVVDVVALGFVLEVGHKWVWPSGFVLDLKGSTGTLSGHASSPGFGPVPIQTPLNGIGLFVGYRY